MPTPASNPPPNPLPPGGGAGKTVLLRHDLPDGTWHYDWLIQRPDSPGLLTFRVDARPDDAGVAEFTAQRLPDHRPLYLTFEGEIAGGRGLISRLTAGFARIALESDKAYVIEAAFADHTRHWRGEVVAGRILFKVG